MRGFFEEAYLDLKKNSVFLDREKVSIHFLPEKLPYREKQEKEISRNLAFALNGKKPNNFFIYGKVGTGKTAVTKKVLNELLAFSEEKNLPVKGKYVNCRTYNSKYKIAVSVVQEFYPNERLIGFSYTYVYEKMKEFIEQNSSHFILVLDEIDKVKDIDDLMYSLIRLNDELKAGSLTIIGISNNLLFKNNLNMQTKSCLCEQELVFPPYNADELSKILEERIKDAFKQGAVSQEAINLISAYSAQEAGDARRALILLQKSGDLADLEKSSFVGAKHVQEARKKVEQELILNMVLTLPKQHQIALYTIALLDLEGKGTRKLNELNSNFSWESLGNYVKEQRKETVLTTGEIYDRYKDLAESIEMPVVSTRWFKEYLNELESYGLVLTTESGKGFRGTTTLTRLGFQANKIKEVLEKELF